MSGVFGDPQTPGEYIAYGAIMGLGLAAIAIGKVRSAIRSIFRRRR